MRYKAALTPNSTFKNDVRNIKNEYLDKERIFSELRLVDNWNKKRYPFVNIPLINNLLSNKKLKESAYEELFDEFRKYEKLFTENLGGKGEVRKELYLPHFGIFIILDAFIRKGEESYIHRHKKLREIYKVEYGELTFFDANESYQKLEGDIIVFEKSIPHTFAINGEYAVISVIKDFPLDMKTILELEMNVKMDWYAAGEQVPRRDIIELREKRKRYDKILREYNDIYMKYEESKNYF